MKKLVLETTAPFQGLPELVADDEGLFEKEGLIIEWAGCYRRFRAAIPFFARPPGEFRHSPGDRPPGAGDSVIEAERIGGVARPAGFEPATPGLGILYN